MTYAIRPFEPDDAENLAELTLATIRAVGAARYTAAQVDAWASRHPGPERFTTRAAGGSLICVAANEQDTAVAYALLEPDGHLDMLYCHPDHTRQGLANRLLDHSEDEARGLGLTRLYTEASELARPAFERAGYTVQHRRDFDIEGPDGPVSIHNFAMEKLLD